MSLIVFSALLIAALGLTWIKRRGASFAACSVAIFLLLFVGQGWLPRILLNGLQSVPPLSGNDWKAKNAIVVLGAGALEWPEISYFTTHPLGFSRLVEAARLYFKCKQAAKACYVLTSGGDPEANGVSEAEVMKRELVEIGVSETDILTESKSNNTFQNAQFSSSILKSLELDKIVLVTSGVHLRRAMLCFSHFKVDAVGAPSDRLEPIYSLIPIAHNFAFSDLALHEYLGFLIYKLYNFMGWNAAKANSGPGIS